MQAIIWSTNLRAVIKQFKTMSPGHTAEYIANPRFVASLPITEAEIRAISKGSLDKKKEPQESDIWW